MLCGIQVVLKFLLGRMLGVMRSQRSFEYRRLKAHKQDFVSRMMREASLFVQHSVTATNGDTEGLRVRHP